MAVTRLTDIIEPSVFEDYVELRTTELSLLWQSGLVSTNPDFDQKARSGGSIVTMPFWNDLTGTESNVGSDDPTSDSTPEKVTAGQDKAVVHYRNQSWSAADLAGTVAGSDPLAVVGNRVAQYWVRDYQRSLIAAIRGLIADNEANDSGDMVHSIATDDAGAITDAERISGAAIIDASATMGDHSQMLVAMVMHSVPYHHLLKNDLIEFIPDSEGKMTIPTYLGKVLMVDDGMPAVAGVNRITYWTAIFARDAFGFGLGAPRVPVEVFRNPAGGDGEGVETLHHRRHYILHPRGVEFTNSSVAGKSPTNAELQTAANWNRVYARKLVRMAILKTNG